MRLAISGLIGFCITSIEVTPATRISAKSIYDYERDVLCEGNIYVARLDIRAHPRPQHPITRSLFLVSPGDSAIPLRLCARVAAPLLITVALQV